MVELTIYIVIFVFVFSLLYNVRMLFKFLTSLFSEQPRPLELDSKDLIYIGLSLSYIITSIVYLLK